MKRASDHGRAARLLIGNLDCERHWQTIVDGGPRQPLPARVLRHLAGVATLMRIFAGDGADDRDAILLPAPLDPARYLEVSGLPRPRLVDPGEALPEADEKLLWGAIDATSARVNDRRFALRLSDADPRLRLPGARLVADSEELDEALAGHRGDWVVKSRFGAAGRDRLVHRGAGRYRPHQVDRLFQRHGELLFEPWVERLVDAGAVGYTGPAGFRVVGRHRLVVGAGGGFRGIDTRVDLLDEERVLLDLALARAGEALADEGYVGPFGIDAFRYRTDSGAPRFHPLVEINARHTFGHVAHALATRLHSGGRLRLLFGAPPRPRAGVVHLVDIDRSGRGGAWLELGPILGREDPETAV